MVEARDKEEAATLAEAMMSEEFAEGEDGFLAAHAFTANDIKEWAAEFVRKEKESEEDKWTQNQLCVNE